MTKYRRSVSFSPQTYVRLRNYCKRKGKALAGFLDALVGDALDDRGEPEVGRDEAVAELEGSRLEFHRVADASRDELLDTMRREGVR